MPEVAPPSLKKFLLGQYVTPLLVAAVTLLMGAFMLWRPSFSEFIEYKLYDLKFHFRGKLAAGPEVAILAIDDASLKDLGRWPWSREVMAEVLTRLKAAGPRVIGLDIIFAEREETSALKTLRHLRREVDRVCLPDPALQALLDQEEQRADVDRRLAQVIFQDPPTILGFFFHGVGGVAPGVKSSQFMSPSAVQASTYNYIRWRDTEPSQLPLMGAVGIETNLPEIVDAAAGGGYFNMVPDPDGTIRWLPTALIYQSYIFAPLSLVSLQHFLGQPNLGIILSRVGVEEARLGDQRLPVDRYGRLYLNYLGGERSFPTYSVADLMKGSLPAEALRDKIVLVGATAVGIYDLRVTPFSGICPGIEVQATLIDNVLRGNLLRTLPFAPLPTILICACLGLLLALVLPRLGAALASLFTVVLAGAFISGNYLLFTRAHLQVELLYPLGEILLVHLGITVQRFLAEERERLRLKKAFQSFVAPEVVNQIIKHPERLRLGGERRELTILFSDIRGFTTLSENMEPEPLVELLHQFLNPMSDIIVRHGGTIDKYIGDAIMALFGAPLEQPDHARRACLTALDMVAKLTALSQEWVARGQPPLQMGIGLNSGPVAVGNMGSDRLFDYTAVGDNVNLASRLEGLTKHYNTRILLSSATAQALDGAFILREMDLVKVKGKKHPIVIYELLGESGQAPELEPFLDLYHQGLALFRSRQWSEAAQVFTEALTLEPGDVPAKYFLDRAEGFKLAPPGPEWQPITVMDQK